MKKTPPIIAFVASTSETGKTTLIEALLSELSARGYRVGTVKHSAHSIQVDKTGSDSWRFTRAGAVNSVIVSGGIVATIRSGVKSPAEEALLDAAAKADIVLVEGYKQIDLPKIEVYREGHTVELVSAGNERAAQGIIAVAASGKVRTGLPVLPLDEPAKVCDFIEERFLKE